MPQRHAGKALTNSCSRLKRSVFRCYFSFCLDERIRNSTIKFDLPGLQRWHRPKCFKLAFDLFHVFWERQKSASFSGQLPRGLGTPVPTTRPPASPVATEATKLEDFEPMSAAPDQRISCTFRDREKTTPFGKNTNCNLRHGDGSTCAEPGHAHSARTCHAGMDGMGATEQGVSQ